ncbi:MAG TPA: FtsX-like permease family protein [Acidobacteriaceae bacterium]|nr:FtsX-like permease family protein [Acidobacteriaceae bacterium]
MNKLVFGNLIHRPLRSVISALAVAIEVIMILSIVGIMYGILNGSRDQASGTGYDMIARPSAGSAILSTSSASASVKVADVLRGLPHVEVASPVGIKLLVGSSVQNLLGIDYESYNALKPFEFKAGGPFQGPYDILIDSVEAANSKAKVGDVVKIAQLGRDFRICGIVAAGKGARRYIQLTTMDAIDGTPGKAALFYLRTSSAPEFQKAVRAEILATEGMSDWNVQTLQELLSQLTPEHIPAFNIGIRVVIGIAAVIGFLVIFQSMYTAVMERTREIGILKSMGASKGTIVSVVLRETGLLAVCGVIIGIVATVLLKAALHARFPSLSFQLTPEWAGIATLITLVGAVLGATYPALKAARKDPIEALSYE